ncbi:hypothetical protein KVL30_06800 [Helicobacter pylori]|nr:hypothetical protein KVL30_06800 [Helicobacter pylori]
MRKNHSKYSWETLYLTTKDYAINVLKTSFIDYLLEVIINHRGYIVTSRMWNNNPYFDKYKLSKANNQIIQSSADGSSSASAFMFKSIQEGDFLMSDLLSTPYY